MNHLNKKSISLILIIKNEEKNLTKYWTWLKRCKTIKEIIVVNDFSTDKSVEFVKTLASKKRVVKIFDRGLGNNFAEQRNFAISKTSHNWILWLDADEKPSSKLIRFLNHINDQKLKYKNYAFKRNDIFLCHELNHGETANQYFLRFFNKKFGCFTGNVHEIWQSPKETKYEKIHIHHYSHLTLKSFIQKLNFYSDIRAQELFDQNVPTGLSQIICYPKGKFLQDYFLKLGFLDGTPGIIMALGMSFYSFLVRAKLWHLQQK